MGRLGELPQLFQKTRSVLDGKSFGTAYTNTIASSRMRTPDAESTERRAIILPPDCFRKGTTIRVSQLCVNTKVCQPPPSATTCSDAAGSEVPMPTLWSSST